MPTRAQVNRLLDEGLDHEEIGRRLNIPAGQVHLIGSGATVDGSDAFTAAERDRAGVLSSAQHLLGVPVHNPSSRAVVHDWIGQRVAADPAMREAQRSHDEQGKG